MCIAVKCWSSGINHALYITATLREMTGFEAYQRTKNKFENEKQSKKPNRV